jgi:hypothetical protein
MEVFKQALEYISLIALLGAAISFVFGFVKWLDQRKRDEEQKHFEAFHKMVVLAGGTDESGRTLKMVQQVAAIYQLQHYKRFAFASVPVLELLKFELESAPDSADPRLGLFHKALDESIAALKKHTQIA